MNDDIEDDIRELIRFILNMPAGSVRPADENQPNEGNEYAIVQYSESIPRGWSGEYGTGQQSGIAVFTIDFMGDNSASHSRNLPLALQSFYAVNYLNSLNMGYVSCSGGRNLTALEIDRTKRYMVELRLSYVFSYERPQIVDEAYGEFDNINITIIGEP